MRNTTDQVNDLVEFEAEGDLQNGIGINHWTHALLVAHHQVLKQTLLIRDTNRGRHWCQKEREINDGSKSNIGLESVLIKLRGKTNQ